jgi:hypothetical protein
MHRRVGSRHEILRRFLAAGLTEIHLCTVVGSRHEILNGHAWAGRGAPSPRQCTPRASRPLPRRPGGCCSRGRRCAPPRPPLPTDENAPRSTDRNASPRRASVQVLPAAAQRTGRARGPGACAVVTGSTCLDTCTHSVPTIGDGLHAHAHAHAHAHGAGSRACSMQAQPWPTLRYVLPRRYIARSTLLPGAGPGCGVRCVVFGGRFD